MQITVTLQTNVFVMTLSCLFISGYTELSLGDQVHLIECCWMELLLLNCAFRSMEHGGRGLAFAHDLILERLALQHLLVLVGGAGLGFKKF